MTGHKCATNAVHKSDAIAANIALVICTTFSSELLLNAGAIPVKIIAAGAKNARNWNVDPSDISNHAGINKNAIETIMIGNQILSQSFFSLKR